MSSSQLFRRIFLILFASVFFFASSAALAQGADAVLRGFVPSGDFIFEYDNEELFDAEIYFSQSAVAYLIMTNKVDLPLMVSPRSQAVESVNLMKVVKKDDGTIDILADAMLSRIASFSLSGQEVVWAMDGKQCKLKPRPDLLGRHTAERMATYDPSYGFAASKYTPNPSALERLKKVSKDVKVVAYFGSWCPTCKRMIPNLIRVTQELDGSSPIKFEYYGLPKPMSDDPISEKLNLPGVPTIVVLVNGEEAGRLNANDLVSPETSLSRLLGV